MIRVDALRDEVPETVEEAQTTLRAIISSETARLRTLKSESLDAFAAFDRDAAVAASHFDDSSAAVLLRRYETACERELRRAVSDLSKVPTPVAPAEPAPVDPPLRNEPNPAPAQPEPVSALACVRTASAHKHRTKSGPAPQQPPKNDAPAFLKSKT